MSWLQFGWLVCFVFSDQPLQALPVLEVDGVKFCQGAAIARYLAREFGLYNPSCLKFER